MGPFVTSMLFSIGIGVWVYTKLARQTGYGNQKSAYIGAGISALVIFIILFSTLSMIM